MRFVSVVPAVLAVLISGAAVAQEWAEFIDREDHFLINFPGDPSRTETTFKTAKGTSLPAHVYAAQDRRGSYKLTVVDYNNAKDEAAAAMDYAAGEIRKRGTTKYAEVNQLDNHRSWRITVEIPGQRVILGEVLMAANNRLYMLEAETAVNQPPPAQFQASLQVLNDEGVRIRYREGTPATPDEILPVSPEAYGAEATRVIGLISGSWRNAGGSCTAPVFKTGERTKTKRGEDAMAVTLVNAGVTFTGQAILSGAREGQVVDPATDGAIFIFDPQSGRLPLSFLGGPTAGWPEVTLEPCRG